MDQAAFSCTVGSKYARDGSEPHLKFPLNLEIGQPEPRDHEVLSRTSETKSTSAVFRYGDGRSPHAGS